MISTLFTLLYTFFKIGLFGFGGGYAMMSMILTESAKLSISIEQFLDLTVLDMVVPGPIAINAATYVGYLRAGLPGALFATTGVMLPSFILVTLVLRFLTRYRDNTIMVGALSGIKPAAVGLIAAAALMIAQDVLVKPGFDASALLTDPLSSISYMMLFLFAAVAFLNIKLRVNPILLTVIAGILGALFVR